MVLHDLSEQLGKIADVSESQLTEQLNRMPDVFIGVTKHPVKVNDTESNLDFFLIIQIIHSHLYHVEKS